MSWLLDALTREYERTDELQRSHDTEYDGGHYATPSLMRRSDLEWIVAVLEKVTRGAEVGGHPTVETGNLRAILNRDEQEN